MENENNNQEKENEVSEPALKYNYIMIDSWSWYARIKRQQPNREWKSCDIHGSNGELTIQEILIETIGYELTLPEIYRDTGL